MLLGIDIGTSGCKAVVIDDKGVVLASALVEYPLMVPRPGWAEQHPSSWWDAACVSVNAAIAKAGDGEIKAIGLSGQMHGMVALDAGREVIRPAILWNDQRNQPQCDEIVAQAGGTEGLQRLTNNQMLPGYTGGKITWLQQKEPENFSKLDLVLNPKDYIRLMMTGEAATDVSDASGTGLFDVRARKWSAELIAKIGLDEKLLPQALESDAMAGTLTAAAAAKMSLPAGVPVVAGGGDAVIQSTGSGIVAPGELQVIVGTAGIVACALHEPVDNDGLRLQIFCNNAPNLWHCMGVSVNAGGALAWLRSVLAQAKGVEPAELGYEEVMAQAAKAAPGAGGLLFLPYLQGERCPNSDPNARGSFVGLNLKHGQPEMVRAVVEGVVYSLADMYALFASLGVERSRVVMSGGGAASPLWRQILADVFDCQVVTVSGASEGGAYGAALVAGVGCGVWSDLPQAAAQIKVMTEDAPTGENKSVYKEMLEIYQNLYKALKPSFDSLSSLN